jgi:hypothetical protein
MFNYDWFHNGGLDRQIDEAKRRCTEKHFEGQSGRNNGKASRERFSGELETRIILYLKDGLSYEMREIAEIGISSALAFECVPVDDNYAVGAYVIVVPFEDIARIEVFAVHPEEKPVEQLRIPGFKANQSEASH